MARAGTRSASRRKRAAPAAETPAARPRAKRRRQKKGAEENDDENNDDDVTPEALEAKRRAWEQAALEAAEAEREAEAARRRAEAAGRAYRGAQARQRRGEYRRGFAELEALAAPVTAGEQQRGVAQLTDLPPAFDGADPAPLAELRLALRRWRRVRRLQGGADAHPDAFTAFADAQPRAECPLAWQPVSLFAMVLGSGWLLHALGRLASCARVFGARRGRALWGQRRGLSMCEALARALCGRLDPADARAGETRLCASAGRQLLRLAIQPDAENTAHYQEVLAAARRGVEALREARARGVSVNARHADGRWTAIMVASHQGEAEAVKNLIAVGAALDLQNNQGGTAIMGAAHIGHTAVVTALVEAGAALNSQTNNGYTALALAAEQGQLGAVEALIAAGADLSLPDGQGQTALQLAQLGIDHLIGEGAHFNLLDAQMRTALQLAQALGKHEAAAMISWQLRAANAGGQ